MNKGLEVIEAHYLFDLEYSSIHVLIHPEGLVHAMAEFRDGSLRAEMATPEPVRGEDPTQPSGPILVFSPALELMRGVVRRASSAIFEAAWEKPELRGMGTTLTAALVHGGRAHLVHAGLEVREAEAALRVGRGPQLVVERDPLVRLGPALLVEDAAGHPPARRQGEHAGQGLLAGDAQDDAAADEVVAADHLAQAQGLGGVEGLARMQSLQDEGGFDSAGGVFAAG